MVGELLQEIEQLVGSDDFEYEMEEKMSQIEAEGAGFEIVDDLIRMMERHPLDDFGAPGAMVHFIERFSPRYEPLLVESIKRSPSMHTLWMLNRCINADHKAEYVNILEEVAGRKNVEKLIRDTAREFVDFQTGKET
ncbi:MAG: hypothetical protein NC121_03450 [Blautia sp.]|nr:hypothetical protein [Blautia sp.]